MKVLSQEAASHFTNLLESSLLASTPSLTSAAFPSRRDLGIAQVSPLPLARLLKGR